MKAFWKLLADSRGASAVEYALICSLIVVVCMGAIVFFADATISMWNGVSDNLSNSM